MKSSCKQPSMYSIGYLYKHIETRPNWLETSHITYIYSLSGCISVDFADYIDFWKHNGFWLFDSPDIMEKLALEHSISLEGLKLFYYEAHDEEFDDTIEKWRPYQADPSFTTQVIVPKDKHLEGFDVVNFTVNTSPECSPLSCNSLRKKHLPIHIVCLILLQRLYRLSKMVSLKTQNQVPIA